MHLWDFGKKSIRILKKKLKKVRLKWCVKSFEGFVATKAQYICQFEVVVGGKLRYMLESCF